MFKPTKPIIALYALATTAAGTASAYWDCKGFSYMELDIGSSTVAAATNRPSVLKLSEGDTTDATAFADVTAFVGDGTGGFTIPSWFTNTATQSVLRMNVDLRTRKRYLKLTISPRTTQDYFCMGKLGFPEIAPVTATDLGVLALVSG